MASRIYLTGHSAAAISTRLAASLPRSTSCRAALQLTARAAEASDAEPRLRTSGLAKPVAAARAFLAGVAGSLLGRRRWHSTAMERSGNSKAALDDLRAAAQELREHPPPFLLGIEGPLPAALLVDDKGDISRPGIEQGPWDIFVILAGDPQDPAFYAPLRVRLRFDGEWPQADPKVYIGGQLSFGLVGSSRAPPQIFWQRLRGDGPLALPQLLAELRRFLLEPMQFLGLPDSGEESEALPEARQAEARRARMWCRDARRVNADRLKVMQKYSPQVRHPDLFDLLRPLKAEWFHPEVWAVSQSTSASGIDDLAWRGLLTEHAAGEVYSLPLFTQAFCDTLLEEIFNFYSTGLPARRPNSMNNYGIILNDIGLEPFIDKLQTMLQPLGQVLFPGPGSGWDGHHCFIVRYREGEDLGLDMHTDDSDVTFNVCLGLDFEGAGLQFCGAAGAPDHRKHSLTYQHQKGHCVVHLGRKRHGADDISSGERLNLILWNHSSEFRRSRQYRQPAYSKEESAPDAVCVSYTHDRDFGNFKQYPKGKEAFRGRGWCPPSAAEYPGFKPDVTFGSRTDVASAL